MSGGASAATILSYGAMALSAVSAVKSLSGSDKEIAAPAAPALTAPTVMPVPDDAAATSAKKRALSALTQRRGRASTNLDTTQSADLLGGG